MMDEIDKRIVDMLNVDGRISSIEIARALEISEGTVRNRIKKMTDSNILKVIGLINPDLMPDKQLFMLGVKVATSKDLTNIAEEISTIKDVMYVYITTGHYDLIVELWLPSKHGLIDFISGHMAAIDGIVATESFLVMKSMKKWISERG